ncbi:endolytic transglycosylase MltG [Streptomyces sp. NPDC000410]|uniref:endolytic transglycosylase MltG n=1 Tax=Streptomyces sp. NPDC000410 TaxID=3154254 RepID=UPI0033218249
MTDYGRGSGSEPWHPEDPLYGDQGWRGQQGGAAPSAPYGDQQQYGGGYQEQYQGQGQHQGQHQGQYQDPYQQQHPQPQYSGQPQYVDPQQYGDQQYATPQQYVDPQYVDPQYTGGGWDTGQQPAMPYAPDPYGTPEAYPPPQPPGHRSAPEPEPAPDIDPEPDPQEENHPFFTDDGPADPRRGGGGRDRRGKTKKKGRNGVACLFVAVVLAGGAGGLGYVGYQFWQAKFAPAPDFTGEGTGSVQVEIPQGANGSDIGNALKQKGVVKSVDAFIAAQNENPQGKSIQAGVYTLRKEMSAKSAVEAMLKPANRNALSIPEGQRNAWIYARIDERLQIEPGTTESVARAKVKTLGLPDWAQGHKNVKDPLEGFLFPATYPVAQGTKPEEILKTMVARANEEYSKVDLDAKAKQLGLKNPWELVTVASLVQAEGKTKDDYRKMSEVVYNRLKPTNTETNRKLQFDSSFNYLKGQSEIDITEEEINNNHDPYNTYTQEGLTPGPIGNPGQVALGAAMNPTSEGWIYFVATDGKHKTEFAKTYAEFQRLRDKFNEQRGSD